MVSRRRSTQSGARVCKNLSKASLMLVAWPQSISTRARCAPQVVAAAAGDDLFHGDAMHSHGLRQRDHALHPLTPLAQHVLGERVQGLHGGVEKVAQHMHFAAMQLTGELDARNEPQ